ncbi:MAG: hypothetical protein JEZ00_20800 [Anaerolineaceae bacterium]|nr:hypothetical protein [Anaerolineaceae bacterium]
MSDNNKLTVSNIFEESSVVYPDWVTSLGEAILEITGDDVTIAAMQAADLYSNPILAKGMESLINGYLYLDKANWDKLTPNQIMTLRDIINGLLLRINNKFTEEGEKIPHIKELR